MSRTKIISLILGIGAILLGLFYSGLYSGSLSSSEQTKQSVVEENGKPVVTGTVPANLDQSTIIPNKTIEIHFSEALENVPETKWELQPGADIKADISDDHKTLKLIPNKPFNLGQSYTLFIKGETKIEGRKTLDKEYIYHFKTIEFKGA